MNNSSGASIVFVDFVVGNADSSEATGTFEIVDIMALGYNAMLVTKL